MKIERELFDNGKKIVHINYSNREVKKIIKEHKKRDAERRAKIEAEAAEHVNTHEDITVTHE